MRLLGLVVVWTLFAGPVEAQDDLRLDARQEAALEDLERRHPRMARRMLRRLQWRRPEVLRRLEEHAAFLDELGRARDADPERFRLMNEQQAMAWRTRELVEDYRAALHDEGRDAVEAELRVHLARWFDVRQALRTHRLETVASEIAEQRERLEGPLEGPSEAALEAWLARITSGGETAMSRRLAVDESNGKGELDVLAPALVEWIGRFEPEVGEELGRLSERDPERFQRRLEDVVERHPDVLELARRERAEELELHRELRDAIRAAVREVLPLVRARRTLGLPGLPEPARAKLHAVLAAERGLSGRYLERATAELERQRALLAERAARKDLIVAIQLDRLIGPGLYAW